MLHSIQLFIWLPLIGFLISVLLPKKKEKFISIGSIFLMSLHFIGIVSFITVWLFYGHKVINVKHIVLFSVDNIEIFIDFYFDKITAVFALIGSALSIIVLIFSRFYLHREEGFKRYFSTILLFLLGYNLVVFSGNFETLFIGWEILGICSFLLIAFYRDRYLPVKNSFKIISIYRLGDICLILAMWMSHHLWNENITFIQLNDSGAVKEHLIEHNWYGFFIALMILIAAIVKSAQFPFSSWLPRALEGPTTSSAIFYGSLSVHLGVFVLLRTYPYWESILTIKVTVVSIGLLTAIIAGSIAKVQSSVKTQIAYASISQIGLIFVEVAFGFHFLALFHFTGNAFLRTYQLLVSPSVLGYSIHNMIFNYAPKLNQNRSVFLSKIKNTFYILAIKEWNMDSFQRELLWNPFKWLGTHMNFLKNKYSILSLILIYGFGLYFNIFQIEIDSVLFENLPYIYSFIGFILIVKAFAERGDAIWAWSFVVGGQLFITLSIAILNENFGSNHILLYLVGSISSAIIGYICLRKIQRIDNNIDLNRYHGYVHENPKLSMVFLLSCLGMIGLPFTPTFIGIDILFSHIHKHEEILIVFTSLSFVFIELAILRIYSRVFLGQHKKATHPIAFKSS